jgi:hypothetical protein
MARKDPSGDIAGTDDEGLGVLKGIYEKAVHSWGQEDKAATLDRIDQEQALRQDARRNPEDLRDRPHP